MMLSNFNKNLAIGLKMAGCMGWDIDNMKIMLASSEIQLYQNPQTFVSSVITISKKTNIKHKLLRVQLVYQSDKVNMYGIKETEVDDLYTYKKKPGHECEHNNRRSILSKDNLFNQSLERNIITNYQEIIDMIEIMDDINEVIQIYVTLYNSD